LKYILNIFKNIKKIQRKMSRIYLDMLDVVSVCGLLKEIDWSSDFKNCAKAVTARILCRDSSKFPVGRLFNFHGNLFQLQFTAELDSVAGVTGNIVVQAIDEDQNGNGQGGNGNSDISSGGSGGFDSE
jgi:hypothetical protein